MTAARATITAYERGPAVLHATIHGLPIPQGSIRSLGRGRPSVYNNAERLKPWRERLFWELRQRASGPQFPMDEGVIVDMIFTMPKPKSAPKTRRIFPTKRPDRLKLARAVEDALTEAGVLKDDSLVVDGFTTKVFPNEHPLALSVPGAVVYVYVIGPG